MLEVDLGERLFVRSGPRVRATDVARVLADRLGAALLSIDLALDQFHASTPPLRVTTPPTFGARWLAPRLPRYQTRPDAVPIELDVSVDLRPGDEFDVAIRTGEGPWAGFEATPLSVVECTPMLAPALARGVRLAEPADLASLLLLPHPDWQRWFAAAGLACAPPLRLAGVEYPTHELNAKAAMEGQGVALLSPSLFQPLLAEGKLTAPFRHVLHGPLRHFMLIRRNERRAPALGFHAWMLDEAADGRAQSRPPRP